MCYVLLRAYASTAGISLRRPMPKPIVIYEVMRLVYNITVSDSITKKFVVMRS